MKYETLIDGTRYHRTRNGGVYGVTFAQRVRDALHILEVEHQHGTQNPVSDVPDLPDLEAAIRAVKELLP